MLQTHPELAQAYEALANQLRLLAGRGRLKSVLVSSACAWEGKTTVSVNLGLTLMQAGGGALLIDADLRNPRLHEVLELENTHGLADIVTEVLSPKELRAVVQTLDFKSGTSLKRYSLGAITSGKVNVPAFAALGSAHVKDAVHVLAAEYDFVILDSPPILAFNDALLLAPVVDTALLVLATGLVRDSEAQRAKALLEGAGISVAGVVMNQFDPSLHGSLLNAAYGSSSSS